MLKEQRQQVILEWLNKQEFIKNSDLSKITKTTVQTIINDISFLDQQKKLVKVYGGAKSLVIKISEPYEEEKINKNKIEKGEIGKIAAKLVTDTSFIFIDAGTTTKSMIKYLTAKNLTVVTNGYAIAKELIEYNIKAILLGGEFLAKTKALVGEVALNQLKEYYFDFAFIGANAINKNGIFTTNIAESSIKNLAIHNSENCFILVDNSKFEQTCPVKIIINNRTKIISNIKNQYYF